MGDGVTVKNYLTLAGSIHRVVPVISTYRPREHVNRGCYARCAPARPQPTCRFENSMCHDHHIKQNVYGSRVQTPATAMVRCVVPLLFTDWYHHTNRHILSHTFASLCLHMFWFGLVSSHPLAHGWIQIYVYLVYGFMAYQASESPFGSDGVIQSDRRRDLQKYRATSPVNS